MAKINDIEMNSRYFFYLLLLRGIYLAVRDMCYRLWVDYTFLLVPFLLPLLSFMIFPTLVSPSIR
jgi:hypothetical protein